MLNITKAMSIPGWMSEKELVWLAAAAVGKRQIAEIGCWRGRSTRALADNTKAVIYCIDTWDNSAVGIKGWWSGPADDELHTHDNWLYNEFCKNLGDCSHAIPFRTTSMEACALLGKFTRFDMVFIDADHRHEAVRADIKCWGELLNPGGLLCGHDFDHPDCPGVRKAVEEVVVNFRVENSIWYAV